MPALSDERGLLVSAAINRQGLKKKKKKKKIKLKIKN